MVVNHRGSGFLTRSSTYQACDLGQVTQLGKASVAVRLKKDHLFGTMPGAQLLSRERQTDFVSILPCPDHWGSGWRVKQSEGEEYCLAEHWELSQRIPLQGHLFILLIFSFRLLFSCSSSLLLQIWKQSLHFLFYFPVPKANTQLFFLRVFIARHKGGKRKDRNSTFSLFIVLSPFRFVWKRLLPKAKAFILDISSGLSDLTP